VNRSKREQPPARRKGNPHPERARAVPGVAAEFEDFKVVERDGAFWVLPRFASAQRGPYASLIEAIEDQSVVNDDEIEPGETLAEAEAEMGVADWIDPDTSELAEDSVPHIEEH
jgi:hypothetical protein